MRLPTRVRYAVRAVVELAGRGDRGPVPVKDLAEAQQIPPKYVKQLMNTLQRKGIVNGHPGQGGGYTLGGNSKDVTVLDVYRAMGETLDLAPCIREETCCRRQPTCAVGNLWADLGEALEKHLGSVTINDLVLRGRTLTRKRSALPKPGVPAASRREGVQ